jgi:hypothetical protein
MTPVTLLPDVLAVKIQHTDAENFRIHLWGMKLLLSYDYDIVKRSDGGSNRISNTPLPPGSYEIIGIASSLTEEQAAQISPGQWSKYFENRDAPLFQDFSDGIWRFDTALESLSSLLKSKGLVGNYLLIKRKP